MNYTADCIDGTGRWRWQVTGTLDGDWPPEPWMVAWVANRCCIAGAGHDTCEIEQLTFEDGDKAIQFMVDMDTNTVLVREKS